MKPNLKLVPKAKQTVERPFENDYAGLWKGHCKTRESAIDAAERRIVRGAGKCTITDKRTGVVVARISTTNRRKRIVIDMKDPVLDLLGY